MITVTEYSGRNIAVYGLGRSGLAAARALMAGGAKVFAWDDGAAARSKAASLGINVVNLDERDWSIFAALVLSPGIPFKYPEPHRMVRRAEQAGVPVIGDMELFASALRDIPASDRPKIIGITGTNGKSTTTSLIGHILAEAGLDVRIGGNIGTGVLELAPPEPKAVYVIEVSSYQLDLCQNLHCDVSVLLNISPDHLSRHGGMSGYIEAKLKIFANQTARDVAIVGIDDPVTQSIAMGNSRPGQAHVIPVSAEFGLAGGVSAVSGHLYDSTGVSAMKVGNLASAKALPGRHNFQNASAAYAACRALGVSAARIMAGLQSFPGLAHRLERVDVIDDVVFINDSKATNAQATEQALRTWPRVHWIVGGVAKAEGIAPLDAYLERVERAYLIGESSQAFKKHLTGKVPLTECETLDVAVRAAFSAARQSGEKDPIVLLSPACASFDQFKDFEARGDVFKNEVANLTEKTDITPVAAL